LKYGFVVVVVFVVVEVVLIMMMMTIFLTFKMSAIETMSGVGC